jgi:hypothetical protein
MDIAIEFTITLRSAKVWIVVPYILQLCLATSNTINIVDRMTSNVQGIGFSQPEQMVALRAARYSQYLCISVALRAIKLGNLFASFPGVIISETFASEICPTNNLALVRIPSAALHSFHVHLSSFLPVAYKFILAKLCFMLCDGYVARGRKILW